MGSRTERLLKEDVEELGWTALKTDLGGSGGFKTGSDAGDLLVGRTMSNIIEFPSYVKASQCFVIEEKYRSSTDSNGYAYARPDADKIATMIEWAEAFGATPLIACRWSTQAVPEVEATHYITDARNLSETDSGNLSSISPEEAMEWETTEEFFG